MLRILESIAAAKRLPESEIQYFLSLLKRVEVAEGAVILHAGSDASRRFIAERGLLQASTVTEAGSALVMRFFGPGEIAIDYTGFLKRIPSSVNIEAVIPSEIWELPADISVELHKRNAGWVAVDFEILQTFILKLSQRENDLLSLAAADHYLKIREHYAAVFDLIPQKNLAGYLGITPESLSRVVRSVKRNAISKATGD